MYMYMHEMYVILYKLLTGVLREDVGATLVGQDPFHIPGLVLVPGQSPALNPGTTMYQHVCIIYYAYMKLKSYIHNQRWSYCVLIPYREAEAESSVSKLQVVQEVSKIAKEFGAIKRQVEISHLTNFCSQLQVEQAVEDGGGGVVTRGSSHVCLGLKRKQ